MNRFYVIVPVVLLALFGFFYWQYMQTAEQKEKDRLALIAKDKADADAKKKAAEEKAKADAERRAQEREAEEKKKADDKRKKYEADIQKIRDDIAKYNTQASDNAKQVAKLEQELSNLRASKEKLNREAFELNKQVERAQVDKRNAEFEIQRLTDMIAKRANDSLMPKAPVVAANNP
jgi:chromosome segregation ATPase